MGYHLIVPAALATALEMDLGFVIESVPAARWPMSTATKAGWEVISENEWYDDGLYRQILCGLGVPFNAYAPARPGQPGTQCCQIARYEFDLAGGQHRMIPYLRDWALKEYPLTQAAWHPEYTLYRAIEAGREHVVEACLVNDVSLRYALSQCVDENFPGIAEGRVRAMLREKVAELRLDIGSPPGQPGSTRPRMI